MLLAHGAGSLPGAKVGLTLLVANQGLSPDVARFQQEGEHALLVLYDAYGRFALNAPIAMARARQLIGEGFSLSPEDRAKAYHGEDTDDDMYDPTLHQTLFAGIKGWTDERDTGAVDLTIIPDEVIQRGAGDITAYFKAMRSRRDRCMFQKKVCVVGPSFWGKTSFIKSMVHLAPTRENADNRTIGIDLSSWEFVSENHQAQACRYKVLVWDFAGQNEYQSAHSLFYSKRTMYVLCIDLEAYASALANVSSSVDSTASNSEMDQFVDKHIYHWVRVICAREPESEFVLVGTKPDRVGYDESTIATISADLLSRIQHIESQIVRKLKRHAAALRRDSASSDEVAMLESLIQKRPRFLGSELLVANTTDRPGLLKTRDALQHMIIDSGTSFQMPTMYMKVASFLRAKVTRAKQSGSANASIEDLFVSVNRLRQEILDQDDFKELSNADVTAILHVLHCLGEVLWFDETCSTLSKTVFISPALVIDFIRQIINHVIASGADAVRSSLSDRKKLLLDAVHTKGCVAHELLEQLELWSRIYDDQLMLRLKELLYHFQLAYPAGKGGLRWNSDLIVPVYWKKLNLGVARPAPAINTTVLTECCSWQYEFMLHLPETVFDKFSVQSFSVHLSSERFFSVDSFDTVSDGKHHVRVSAKPVDHEDSEPNSADAVATMNIQVWAASRELMWSQLLLYVMNMEKVLIEYCGLWVVRSILSPDGKRVDLQELLGANHQTDEMRKLLPPNMDWYVDKKWLLHVDELSSGFIDGTETDRQVTGYVQQLDAKIDNLNCQVVAGTNSVHTHLDNVKQALLTQGAAEGNRRDFPALWTLEYQQDGPMLTSTFVLRIRSHLTGKCYHEPIELTVPRQFFGKYGVAIKVSSPMQAVSRHSANHVMDHSTVSLCLLA
jgi:GTPase SAR1 family protein